MKSGGGGGGVGGCCSLEAAVGEFIFIHITALSMHVHFHVRVAVLCGSQTFPALIIFMQILHRHLGL